MNDTLRATFTYAVCYRITAKCQTPLRTGGADGDTELVLTASNGQPLIQGSSLAGALRAWMQQAHGTAAAEALFGSQKRAGHLIVSEGKFSKNAVQSIRPRLKIDPKTGSAAERQKFDLAQLNAEAEFDFTLTWLGQGKNQTELEMVEEALSALDGGAIRLGAQKSNGFGLVTLEVKKRAYNMMQEQDRAAWLAEPDKEKERKAWAKNQRKWKTFYPSSIVDRQGVTFTVTGQADSILVKSAAVTYKEGGKEKGSYTPNLAERSDSKQKPEEAVPILPGSSVKGAVRAQAERIAQCTGQTALVEELFGRGPRRTDSGQTGPAGRVPLDKDNGQAGKVRFADVKLNKAQPKQISRIRINRFTGGVIHQGLFEEEPLCSPVSLTVTAPSDCKVGCALLLYALRDLGLGLYNLGSGGSIGRGYLQVEQIEVKRGNSRATLTFPEDEGCTVSDPDGLVAEWMNAWQAGSAAEVPLEGREAQLQKCRLTAKEDAP